MTHVHQGEYLVCGSYSEAKVDKASSSLHAELAEEPSSLSRAKKRGEDHRPFLLCFRSQVTPLTLLSFFWSEDGRCLSNFNGAKTCNPPTLPEGLT